MELSNFDNGVIIWQVINVLFAIIILFLIVRFFLRRKKRNENQKNQ